MGATADLFTGIPAASRTDEAARFDSLPPFLQVSQKWTDKAVRLRIAQVARLISGQ